VAEAQSITRHGGGVLRTIAGIIALLWAGFWIFFGVASGISEGLTIPAIVLHGSMPGLFFLISASAAWIWKRYGGVLLLVEGIPIAIGYPLAAGGAMSANGIITVLLIMALPPIVSGGLFIAAWARSRS
jgi:hypothetical protein